MNVKSLPTDLLQWQQIMASRKCPILIGEDNDIDVMMLRRAFRQANADHPVYSVTDGGEVINYLSGIGVYSDRTQFPLPELILLDLKMPRKTGFEVLSWIRQSETHRSVPVVVLTSSKLHSDINKAYELGANSYFVKSVDADELKHLVTLIEEYWCNHAEKPRRS